MQCIDPNVLMFKHVLVKLYNFIVKPASKYTLSRIAGLIMGGIMMSKSCWKNLRLHTALLLTHKSQASQTYGTARVQSRQSYSGKTGISFTRVYYTLAAWRFKAFLSVGLRVHSYLSGGLRSRNYWRFPS